MVLIGRFNRHWLHVAALGLILGFCALSASPVGAQSVGKANQANSAQQSEDREKAYGKPGIALTCAPSPNGTDYTCYKKPDSKPPSFLGRVGNWLFRLFRDPIAVLTLLLFAIGAIQVRIAQRTAHRQLRAYLAPDFTSITDGSGLTPPFDIGLVRGATVVKNSGQTPAYDVVTWAAIAIARQSEEERLRAPTVIDRVSVASIGPQGSTSHTRALGRGLTPNEIAEVQNHTSDVYIYGRTTYRDIFGKAHFINFRTKYSGLWPPTGTPIMNFCETGNEAD